MNTIEYRFIDRSGWGHGEWDDEPDKVQWQDEATSLPCLAVRHPLGHWCGYVGVALSHPWFGKEYSWFDEEQDESHHLEIDCHGGLTFSDFCQEDEKEHGICHVPAPGEPEKVWWLGFDCCHVGDISPGLIATLKQIRAPLWHGDTYKNLAYVQTECAQIAKQLNH